VTKKKVTKVLKDANINIAFKTQNTIEHILQPKLSTATENIYNNSGICQLKCLDCPKKYIGQTGRTFKTRYKEHLQAIHNNRPDTEYSRPIFDSRHTYGNIEKTSTILRKAKRENS
jgi:transposase-like protein